jgi:hypothetical protein
MKASILFLAPLLFTVHTFALDPPKDLDVGVYVSTGSEWKELPVEIVNWKSGGVFKYVVTARIVKGDLNGRILGNESPIALEKTSESEIFVRTVDGVSAAEYQLLRLREHSNAREFRSVTGGVFHESGGATRDRIQFTPKRVGPNLWLIVLVDLPHGEYGFLPPVNTTSLASSGKIYSFEVSVERIGNHSPTAYNPTSRSLIKSILWPAGDKLSGF